VGCVRGRRVRGEVAWLGVRGVRVIRGVAKVDEGEWVGETAMRVGGSEGGERRRRPQSRAGGES